jgi:hypothetical protein
LRALFFGVPEGQLVHEVLLCEPTEPEPLNLTEPSLALIIFGAGTIAGALGVALGLGGGIFLVPF